jgi:hypothetical protein
VLALVCSWLSAEASGKGTLVGADMHTADAQRRTAAVNGRVVCGLAKGRLLLDNFEQMEATAPPEHARCGDVVTHLREMDRFDSCTLNMHSKGNKPSERLDGGMPAYVCFAFGMCSCASLTTDLRSDALAN